jgi:hypothetical protein
LLALILVAGCDGGCGGHDRSVPSASAVASATAAPPRASAGELAGPWEAAAAGDRQALGRLTELHATRELLELARDAGDPRRDTAFAAIAVAPDAEVVLGELARLGRGDDRALATVLEVARRPPRGGEALDAESLARCLRELDALSRDAAAPRARRVTAVNALRAFARAGYLDEAGVTRELD